MYVKYPWIFFMHAFRYVSIYIPRMIMTFAKKINVCVYQRPLLVCWLLDLLTLLVFLLAFIGLSALICLLDLLGLLELIGLHVVLPVSLDLFDLLGLLFLHACTICFILRLVARTNS